MSVIKTKNEYKLTVSFEVEREREMPSLSKLQEGFRSFPSELNDLLREELGDWVSVTVEEISTYCEEA